MSATRVRSGAGTSSVTVTETASSGGTLLLRGEGVVEAEKHVLWSEEVIDNEHMNKKSSKREFKQKSECMRG